jgi:hypothetical protein
MRQPEAHRPYTADPASAPRQVIGDLQLYVRAASCRPVDQQPAAVCCAMQYAIPKGPSMSWLVGSDHPPPQACGPPEADESRASNHGCA